MSTYTHETVPTRFAQTNDMSYAYRRFGKPGTIPLLLLGYFNFNMDGWDPDVTNGFAAGHEVILFDNAGVGSSGGKTPPTVAEMTKHCVAFCRALGLKQIHVAGFSLGGMIAQQLALEHPQLRAADSLGDRPAWRRGHELHRTIAGRASRSRGVLVGCVLLSL